MDSYVVATCLELGLSELLGPSFPSENDMEFIKTVVSQKSTAQALENDPEEANRFQDHLNNLVSVKEFFSTLLVVMERGSYRSSIIRMDVQDSTRVSAYSPKVTYNMFVRTTCWEKQFTLEPAANDALLESLNAAKTIIRKNKKDCDIIRNQ